MRNCRCSPSSSSGGFRLKAANDDDERWRRCAAADYFAFVQGLTAKFPRTPPRRRRVTNCGREVTGTSRNLREHFSNV